MNAAVQHCFIPKEYLRSYYELRFFAYYLLGSVDLSRLNLQQFVWYLGKAKPM
nr:hypothetical protein [Ningiella sp. W23]